ncbi:uncharacterized protein N7511_010354 [Penicillium nucicola]|uniref:uncharacterized protein n=1 Tax=Penicillium nucicola TaxID=1850975 RepID=UPI0025456604|nr:uncharacterized protein N7511_010354 [Penicillium nucicola]KAJ5748658.1 hypothetical protein N7511_010354 [Penicillium nucicola]
MSGKHCYLGVYDISISGTSDIFLITQAHSEDEISGAVAELERQKQDTSTIRVYIDEICDRPVFQELLQNYYSCNFGVDPKLKSYRTGFNGLMSLWKSNANHVCSDIVQAKLVEATRFRSHSFQA